MSKEQRLAWRTILAIGLTLMAAAARGADDGDLPGTFRIWATSCAHVPADIRRGRESLAKVIRQSEGKEKGAPGFSWDIMIDAGDLSAHQKPPGDRDGMELIRQYRALTKHRREQVYNVPGNHDAPYFDHGPGSWFAKWGDPLGKHTEFSGVDPKRRPFPVEGKWERYRFVAGNILFLMLADRNDVPEPVGRGHSKDGKSGGYPAGAVTRETFEWWKKQVIDNQDKIIVTMHHHVLRDTTTASGFGEGNPTYHGSSGGPEGSSYLYYLIEKDDPDDFQFTTDAHVFEDFLEQFEKKNGRGAIDIWVGGHTHVKGPDDNFGGKTITEAKWGVTFLQAAALTVHHGGSHPLSRLVTLTDGSDRALVETYLHEKNFKKQPVGFYKPAARTIPLRHGFTAPPPIESLPPFPESTRVFDVPYVHSGTHAHTDHASVQAKPSLDLTGSWNPTDGGSFELETQLMNDTENRISSKPTLESDGEIDALHFDGSQRLWVGPIEMEDWTDLTVSIWIQTRHNDPGMRVVCKDQIGEPGCFMLRQPSPGVWLMQVWDDHAGKWQTATWRSDAISDGQWHHLVGVVDFKAKKVRLLVDGEQKAEAPWTAETLDDSDETDLVIGADSGRKRFGQGFQGRLHDLRIFPRVVNADELRTLSQGAMSKDLSHSETMRVVVSGILIFLFGMQQAAKSEEAPLTGKIRASIEKALPLLMSSSRISAERRRCFTCHNEGLPTLTLIEARGRGFEIDAMHIEGLTKHTLAHLKRGQSNYLNGIGQGGKADTAGTALWALEAAGHPGDELTDAVIEFLLQRDADTPFWTAQSNRPPAEGSRFTSTFLALRGMDAYGPEAKREAIEQRRRSALEWLLDTEAEMTEDHVFRLRALTLAGAEESPIAEAGRALLRLQRENGSWAQLSHLEGDAYATGSALVALQETRQVGVSEEPYRRGLQFLIDSQEPDGSWHVVSRSRPIQEFYESGFPHGPDQFISCAATSWATLALLHALP